MIVSGSSGFLSRVGVMLACGCDGSTEVARLGAGSTVRAFLRSSGRGSRRQLGGARGVRASAGGGPGRGVGEGGGGLAGQCGERRGGGQVQQPSAAGERVAGGDG